MAKTTDDTGQLTATLAIVGRGRMGTALARALRAAGWAIEGPLGRGDIPPADAVLLCVPDSAIAGAARGLPPASLVGHCSGATTLEPLEPHERFSVHPLLSVTDEQVSFAGAAAAVAGSTARALAFAADLARAVGMQPFEVAERDRVLYHAAASLASNYLVTLESAAEQLAQRAGVSREHLLPLVRGAVENWQRLGARSALTGPVARGDESTVARQRSAVAATAPHLLPLWDSLTEATRDLAKRSPSAP